MIAAYCACFITKNQASLFLVWFDLFVLRSTERRQKCSLSYVKVYVRPQPFDKASLILCCIFVSSIMGEVMSGNVFILLVFFSQAIFVIDIAGCRIYLNQTFPWKYFSIILLYNPSARSASQALKHSFEKAETAKMTFFRYSVYFRVHKVSRIAREKKNIYKHWFFLKRKVNV